MSIVTSFVICNEIATFKTIVLIQNRTEQNKTEQNRTEQNRTEQNRTEQNRTEQNRTEQNRTEQNRTEQNRTEQNRTEQNPEFIYTNYKLHKLETQHYRYYKNHLQRELTIL